MENFEISVTSNDVNYHFEVKDYMHHDGDLCKYEILQNGKFIASFEPDSHKILHICKNAGVMGDDILHLVATQLEGYHI